MTIEPDALIREVLRIADEPLELVTVGGRPVSRTDEVARRRLRCDVRFKPLGALDPRFGQQDATEGDWATLVSGVRHRMGEAQ